jgi:hypothetical protein
VTAAEALERKRRFLAGPGLPPMPDDPAVCRWCGGHRLDLHIAEYGLYCPAGCAPNDFAPYLGHCQDCTRDFHTGRRLLSSDWCWECEARVRATTEWVDPDAPRAKVMGIGRAGPRLGRREDREEE